MTLKDNNTDICYIGKQKHVILNLKVLSFVYCLYCALPRLV